MYNNSDWAWKYLLYLKWSESFSEEKTQRKGLENENCFLGKELGGIALMYKVLQFHYSFFPKIYLFIFGCAGSLLGCSGFSLQWFLLLQDTGYRRVGFSSCRGVAQ